MVDKSTATKPIRQNAGNYHSDPGRYTTMRLALSRAENQVARALAALERIQDPMRKLAAKRKFNEGLDAIRQFYFPDVG